MDYVVVQITCDENVLDEDVEPVDSLWRGNDQSGAFHDRSLPWT
jgi:hypothetical protein